MARSGPIRRVASRAPVSRLAVSWLAPCWLALGAAYLAFAGSLGWVEGGAGVLCGGLAVLWVARIGIHGGTSLRVGPSAALPLGRALLHLPGQTLRIGVRLARAAWRGDVAGHRRPPRPGEPAGLRAAGTDPEAGGTRALAVLCASLSPDGYVLTCAPARGPALLHVLLPEALLPEPEPER